MTNELHLTYRASKWISHSLTSSQKIERKETAKLMYEMLLKAMHNGYANISS